MLLYRHLNKIFSKALLNLVSNQLVIVMQIKN
jgi:hypothetical protein